MKRIGEHAYNVVECRTRRSDPDIARALLLGIRSWAQENRVSYIVVRPYVPMLAQALPKLLTIHVKQRPMTYCYKFKNSADQGNWETTSGDGDVLG
jgi:hypothetical protein